MRRGCIPIASALAGASILAFAGSAVGGQVAFSDQTVAAGLSFAPGQHADMAARPMFSGGSVGDFNRDGWPDLFMLGGGDVADALFLNNGDGTFSDRAADWGVDLVHRGRGSTVGDFNGDGWPDIYLTSSGDLSLADRPGQHVLYRNNGNGTFTNIAVPAGVRQTSTILTTATGAAFGDYDLDGDLDLFVCGWEMVDGNRLFRNDGDETFTDVTASSGVDYGFDGFSPRFVDMNGDRYPELLIAADFVTSRYFLNNQNGTFTNITASTGTGIEDNGMGSTVADFNRDGLPDWYVTSIYRDGSNQDGNHLYVNQSNDSYAILPEASGARDGGWGWGVEALDFDHDGFVDLVETNGWLEPQFLGETSYLFRNNGDLTFSNVQATSGFDYTGQGRSLLTLDYDRDGDMDLAISSFDGPLAFYRNDLSGADIHYIELQLDTGAVPGLAPDGYGARVSVTAGGATQTSWVDGGASYLGRSQPVAHFGLGAATVIDQLSVEWPDGSSTVMDNVGVDQILTISAGGAGPGPGEASIPDQPVNQMRAAFDSSDGSIDITYAPACQATEHVIYFGELADVGTHSYSGNVCGLGASGVASFDATGNLFFVIVGQSLDSEGSYGRSSSGQERPEDNSVTACSSPRSLVGSCD